MIPASITAVHLPRGSSIALADAPWQAEPMRTPPARLATWAFCLMVGAVSAACAKSPHSELRELKEQACACKNKACAVEVGGKLAKVAAERELGEAEAKIAIEASTCLAALGE